MEYASGNLSKYRSVNPLKRYLAQRFVRIVADTVAQSLPPGPNARILDAGCGEGVLLSAIANRIPSLALTGADPSAAALAIARSAVPQAELTAAALPALPFPDAAFDLVLCTEVLEHLADPSAALQELIRVSKGPIIISVPNEPWFRLGNLLALKNVSRLGSDPEHVQYWTARDFVRFISVHAKVERTTTAAFPWTIVVAN